MNDNKFLDYVKGILPGLLVSIAVAFVGILLAKFVPKLGAGTISIFLGMFVGNLFLNQEVFQKGYKFSETDILSYSIVLLGATLSIGTLLELGIGGFVFIILQMAITVIGSIYIGKKLGFSENFRFLMASGNAVCGSSAIAATAPVIEADDKEKGIAITIVKDMAMIVKILSVVLLGVVVFVFGHLKQKSNGEIVKEEVTEIEKKKVKIPWYVIGFFVTCALFSLKIIPLNVSHVCKTISNNLEIIALAAIGLRVNVRELLKQGKAVSLYALGVGSLQIVAALILIFILIR